MLLQRCLAAASLKERFDLNLVWYPEVPNSIHIYILILNCMFAIGMIHKLSSHLFCVMSVER